MVAHILNPIFSSLLIRTALFSVLSLNNTPRIAKVLVADSVFLIAVVLSSSLDFFGVS